MFERLIIWFGGLFSSSEPSPRSNTAHNLRATGAHQIGQSRRKPAKRPKPADVDVETTFSGKIEDAGPGKNVLIRNKYVREDTGTHETLKILDDSLVDSGEETGIDPYNTGGFDRSKNWNNRFRK